MYDTDIIKLMLEAACEHVREEARLRARRPGSSTRAKRDMAIIEQCQSALSAYEEQQKRMAELEAYKQALQFGVIGWREYDWPEGFDRHTADLIVEHLQERWNVRGYSADRFVSVSRETAEIAASPIDRQQAEDAYDNYARAVREIRAALNKEGE